MNLTYVHVHNWVELKSPTINKVISNENALPLEVSLHQHALKYMYTHTVRFRADNITWTMRYSYTTQNKVRESHTVHTVLLMYSIASM